MGGNYKDPYGDQDDNRYFQQAQHVRVDPRDLPIPERLKKANSFLEIHQAPFRLSNNEMGNVKQGQVEIIELLEWHPRPEPKKMLFSDLKIRVYLPVLKKGANPNSPNKKDKFREAIWWVRRYHGKSAHCTIRIQAEGNTDPAQVYYILSKHYQFPVAKKVNEMPRCFDVIPEDIKPGDVLDDVTTRCAEVHMMLDMFPEADVRIKCTVQKNGDSGTSRSKIAFFQFDITLPQFAEEEQLRIVKGTRNNPIELVPRTTQQVFSMLRNGKLEACFDDTALLQILLQELRKRRSSPDEIIRFVNLVLDDPE